MLSFMGGAWGATIEVSNGSTLTADARAMLMAGSWRYWLQGPVVTQVIVEDRSPARSWDLGWDANRSLHPIFLLTFYNGWSGVKIDYVVENAWMGFGEDLHYAVTFKAGSPLSSVYTHPSF